MSAKFPRGGGYDHLADSLLTPCRLFEFTGPGRLWVVSSFLFFLFFFLLLLFVVVVVVFSITDKDFFLQTVFRNRYHATGKFQHFIYF